ncbi:MAG: hypothetical protein HQL90_04260 [Magnetococcales bacterium]|nr:hypothetical protein [Magnetococcales bacterium]
MTTPVTKYPPDVITTTAVTSIGTSEIAAMTTTAVYALTSTQLSQLTTTHINGLTSTQINALSNTLPVKDLTTTQMAGLGTAHIAALTTSMVAALTDTQIAQMTSTQIASLTTTVLAGLTTAQQRAMGIQFVQNGWLDTTNMSLSFDSGTRTLTVSDSGGTLQFWSGGVLYAKSSPQTIQIADTTGTHHIYFDTSGNIQEVTEFTQSFLTTWAYTAAIYWNATAGAAVNIGNELHGSEMDGRTHSYLHATRGTQYDSGLAITPTVVGGNGSLDSHAQIAVGSGQIRDEDIAIAISAATAPATLPVIYRSGASGDWYTATTANHCVKTTGTGRLAWNQWTGATWQLTEVTNNNFVLYHIVATNGVVAQLKSLMGQNEYSTINAARTGALTEISSLNTGGLAFTEWRIIGTIIYKTSDSYANAVKAAVQSTAEGDSYVDWRTNDVQRGVVSGNHNSLSGLQGGAANEYHHLTAAQVTNLTALTTTQVASLNTASVAAMTTTFISALTSTMISQLTSTQMSAFTTTALSGLTSTQLASLTTTAVSGLQGVTASAGPLTTTQMDALSTTTMGALTSTAVGGITTTAMTGFTSTQISALTTSAADGLAYALAKATVNVACTGGDTITTPGDGYRYHIFENSDTSGFVIPSVGTIGGALQVAVSALVVDALQIGGGGAGAAQNSVYSGGGGGAGGVKEWTALSLPAGTNYAVTIGAGAVGANGGSPGASGGETVFNSTTVKGGGGGGLVNGVSSADETGPNKIGGSGGGGGRGVGTSGGSGGTGGNAGAGGSVSGFGTGGGGGGAGSAGSTNTGGDGIMWYDPSSAGGTKSKEYAAGGGAPDGGQGGSATAGDGGDGTTKEGTDGTGYGDGGGGGRYDTANNPGDGKKGVVIIRYPYV